MPNALCSYLIATTQKWKQPTEIQLWGFILKQNFERMQMRTLLFKRTKSEEKALPSFNNLLDTEATCYHRGFLSILSITSAEKYFLDLLCVTSVELSSGLPHWVDH